MSREIVYEGRFTRNKVKYRVDVTAYRSDDDDDYTNFLLVIHAESGVQKRGTFSSYHYTIRSEHVSRSFSGDYEGDVEARQTNLIDTAKLITIDLRAGIPLLDVLWQWSRRPHLSDGTVNGSPLHEEYRSAVGDRQIQEIWWADDNHLSRSKYLIMADRAEDLGLLLIAASWREYAESKSCVTS